MKVIKKITPFLCNTDVQCVEKYEHASFDIFDTLIIRKCKQPAKIFDIVEEKYNKLNGTNLENFRQLRILVEAQLRSKNAEITINDIYSSIANKYGCRISDTLKDLELETELEQCVANPQIIDLYNQYALHHEVFLVSDMYLPSCFIKKILTKNNILHFSKIYISCEYGKTKRNRKLFEQVICENSLNKKEIIHLGDNFISDYVNPRLIGIHSCLITEK